MADSNPTDKRVKPIQGIKGMNDILPPESAHWEWLEAHVRALMQRYGYLNMRTPIVEMTALYVRGLGEVTDIVEKEMYSFTDRLNADELSLRPEGTAGAVRAINEHNFLYEGGKRLYYIGPMFRHERPQKGRYRQFHQVGAEALGFSGPDVDAELILMTAALWRDLGLKIGQDVHLQINSLGQPAERRAHREALIAHFQAHSELLDEEARRRLHSNPLRILDSKNPAMHELIESAPKLIDHLEAASLAHLKGVTDVLDACGLGYTLNPRLVRGMDYYNLTVFEWVTPLLGAQGTVCGGGRYDGLIEQLGGKGAPAVGWGLGMERLLLLLEAAGVSVPQAVPDVFAVLVGELPLAKVMVILERLRAHGLRVQHQPLGKDGPASAKSQFKRADASGAAYALVLGVDEFARDEVGLKSLRVQGEQRSLSLSEMDAWAPSLRQAQS